MYGANGWSNPLLFWNEESYIEMDVWMDVISVCYRNRLYYLISCFIQYSFMVKDLLVDVWMVLCV